MRDRHPAGPDERGLCALCGGAIDEGGYICWLKGTGRVHLNCGMKAEAGQEPDPDTNYASAYQVAPDRKHEHAQQEGLAWLRQHGTSRA